MHHTCIWKWLIFEARCHCRATIPVQVGAGDTYRMKTAAKPQAPGTVSVSVSTCRGLDHGLAGCVPAVLAKCSAGALPCQQSHIWLACATYLCMQAMLSCQADHTSCVLHVPAFPCAAAACAQSAVWPCRQPVWQPHVRPHVILHGHTLQPACGGRV